MDAKTATLMDIIYRNPANGYTVGVFAAEGKNGSFTGVGSMAQADPGNSYELVGEWKEHPSYGRQFAISSYEIKMPETRDGIELFLASGAIKGIGVKMAGLIVGAFGDDALRVIGDEPHRLTEINGIGAKKAAMICESFAAHRDFAEAALFFRQYGISPAVAMRMHRIYGRDTVKAVRENPYQLIGDVYGIGFKSADRIAMRMGIDANSPFRLKSGISYILWQYAGEGSSFVPKKLLLEHAAELLETASDDVEETLLHMVFEGDAHIEDVEGRQAVYLECYYVAEQSVCKDLLRLERAALPALGSDVSGLLANAALDSGAALSDSQKYAVGQSLNSGVFVITGGPGTGKTTIIKTIIRIFESGGLSVGLAAPTGRAAKRMAEATGHDALTLHRMLEYYYSEGDDEMRFRRNRENSLDYQAIIVDEASMADILLMQSLLAAVRSGTRLLIVGDADQLPSVGAGNVLRDMLASEFINSVKLTEIFRQAKESLIVVNAHRINKGEYPELNASDGDFFMLQRNGESRILETMDELCTRRLPSFYKEFDIFRDLQVLTPMRKGQLGCVALNRRLQGLLNPPSKSRAEKSFGERLFREGDKVMQIKNNYQLEWRRGASFNPGRSFADGGTGSDGAPPADFAAVPGESAAGEAEALGEGVFNGDMGVIKRIDTENGIVAVVYDENRYVEYDFTQIEEIELAYAVTVHKSQGSEFPLVLMPVAGFPPMLANRNLLYTAVTRGRKAVILVGMDYYLKAMVDNNRVKERYSGLRHRLAGLLVREL